MGLIERQEKSLTQLETKRSIVQDLITKGKQLMENPDKPKFLDGHVGRIKEGWDETKNKASARLELLYNTKAAWEGYATGLETIVVEFEKGEEEIKKVKKRFNLDAAKDDLAKRKGIFNDTKNTIEGMFGEIQHNYDVMTMTLPEDKKDFVKKEVKAIQDKLEVASRFKEKVDKIDEFVASLDNFDKTLKMVDSWMKEADNQLNDIKNNSDTMTPEDRVSCTMELQEDVTAKVDIVVAATKTENDLLPQGDQVPKDAQDFKDELKRINDYVTDLQKRVMTECEHFSEDVKYWAEYKTGIRGFKPWLEASETGANKMTTHKEADVEVAGLKERYNKVKGVSDEWMKKADTLVKEWKLLDNTVNELNSWVAQDRGAEQEQNFSLEKMESTLGELKNIFKEKERLVDNLQFNITVAFVAFFILDHVTIASYFYNKNHGTVTQEI